jgi:hypothetical protein
MTSRYTILFIMTAVLVFSVPSYLCNAGNDHQESIILDLASSGMNIDKTHSGSSVTTTIEVINLLPKGNPYALYSISFGTELVPASIPSFAFRDDNSLSITSELNEKNNNKSRYNDSVGINTRTITNSFDSLFSSIYRYTNESEIARWPDSLEALHAKWLKKSKSQDITQYVTAKRDTMMGRFVAATRVKYCHTVSPGSKFTCRYVRAVQNGDTRSWSATVSGGSAFKWKTSYGLVRPWIPKRQTAYVSSATDGTTTTYKVNVSDNSWDDPVATVFFHPVIEAEANDCLQLTGAVGIGIGSQFSLSAGYGVVYRNFFCFQVGLHVNSRISRLAQNFRDNPTNLISTTPISNDQLLENTWGYGLFVGCSFALDTNPFSSKP